MIAGGPESKRALFIIGIGFLFPASAWCVMRGGISAFFSSLLCFALLSISVIAKQRDLANMVLSFKKKIPTLLELCIQTAIDNVKYIGDVGETDIYLLKDILPHCTVDQLMHIENSSEGRDLSEVTDSLWKRFYERHFGEESLKLVSKRMKDNKVVFKWRLLYEAKLKERDDLQEKSVERLTRLFAAADAKKQSRQIQLCSKIPPSKKRNFFGGGPCNNYSNVKGNLMKKAKMEYLNSHEARVHQAMRKNDLKRSSFTPPSVSRSTKPTGFLGKTSKPTGFLGKTSASTSKLNKPLS